MIPWSRIFAALLAVTAFSGIAIRVYLHQETGKTALDAFSWLYQFFTIWSNTLVMLAMTGVATNKFDDRLTNFMATVAIMGVGIIFHLLLSSPPNQQGLDLLANLITHTFVPLLSLAWWLAFQTKSHFNWGYSFAGMLFPAVYCLYALLRAEYSGFYPYPFIDLSALGALGLIKSILSISVAFFTLGLILIASSKVRQRVSAN